MGLCKSTPVHASDKSNSSDSNSLLSVEAKETSTTNTYRIITFDGSRNSDKRFINVLLLGESGVGKSTFINAIANYLKYHTLNDALANRPFVVIPVSFIMTTGNSFKEELINFGEVDPNEVHGNRGQSVTQHCRSYVLSLDTHTKLRLIDTPGIGDTRGLQQDDRNVRNILSFIDNLQHLNAVCILLKPNETRLTISFRTYFDRLVNAFGQHIQDHIVFCFTNTRSTFYSPGNTSALVKELIACSTCKTIPFQKRNTFCFESEAFRYLVAQKHGITFPDYQILEYEESWNKSSVEANRFLTYIDKSIKTFSRERWGSNEFAQLRISQMIRPLFETMRNHYRNLILYGGREIQKFIRLKCCSIQQFSTICTRCPISIKLIVQFGIPQHNQHVTESKCMQCTHARDEHIDIYYQLEHDIVSEKHMQSKDDIENEIDRIKSTILEFGQFILSNSGLSTKYDPVLCYLNQIIYEENEICTQNVGNNPNNVLLAEFQKFKEIYDKRRHRTNSMKESINLNEIYQHINNICEITLIQEQMELTQKFYRFYMEQTEKQI